MLHERSLFRVTPTAVGAPTEFKRCEVMEESLPKEPFVAAHILLIDDSQDDRQLLAHELGKLGGGVRMTAITDAQGLQAALDRDDYDLAVTDYALGWTTGLDVFRLIKARNPRRPVARGHCTKTGARIVQAIKSRLGCVGAWVRATL